MGKFPMFQSIDTPMLVYQNCIEMDELDFTVQGYYICRYFLPGDIPNENPENPA
jgi:hypothetical protein